MKLPKNILAGIVLATLLAWPGIEVVRLCVARHQLAASLQLQQQVLRHAEQVRAQHTALAQKQ